MTKYMTKEALKTFRRLNQIEWEGQGEPVKTIPSLDIILQAQGLVHTIYYELNGETKLETGMTDFGMTTLEELKRLYQAERILREAEIEREAYMNEGANE